MECTIYRTYVRLLPVLLDDYSIEVQLMLRFSNFILNASQSDNSHRLYINVRQFGLFQWYTSCWKYACACAQVLNTDCLININNTHVKNRIVHRILHVCIIMFYQKMLNIRQVTLRSYVMYEMVHIRVMYYLAQTLSHSLVCYVVHEVYICFLCWYTTQFSQEWARRKVVVKHSIKNLCWYAHYL